MAIKFISDVHILMFTRKMREIERERGGIFAHQIDSLQQQVSQNLLITAF